MDGISRLVSTSPTMLQFLQTSFLVVSISAKPILRLRPDDTFKMSLFCDLHFGEDASKDDKSVTFEKRILALEDPDLVVIDGDATSNYASPPHCKAADMLCKNWYDYHWKRFTEPMETAGVPYAYTLGNHDRIPGEEPQSEPGIETNYAVPDHWITAKDAMNNHSLTQDGPLSIHGASNYVLPVLNRDDNVVAYVWLLDSSDNNCAGVKGWGCVYPDQVAWFRATWKQLAAKDGKILPGVMFHHIPMDEVVDAWNDPAVEVNGSRGENICCSSKNTGLFQAIKEHGSIWGVFNGHDHNNDFVADYKGVRLGFGRKSGHGGYGGAVADRAGSRIIKLTADSDGSVSWDTWIREETGEKVVQTKANRNGTDQTQCCGMNAQERQSSYGGDMALAAEVCRTFDDAAACRVASGVASHGTSHVVQKLYA
eukprot:TRINITY_DN5955_c0_g1_i3.p1 TRINITY_DN5955_c0_g1~~TRINITY_DN5955_c0_g1_i3.p1  ORF type:complete len:425 (-),score=65.91 TRINITY_DN5955_c0_g1_i3:60-1334(-)